MSTAFGINRPDDVTAVNRADANRWQGAPVKNEERPVWDVVVEEALARLERLSQMKKDYMVARPGEGGDLLEAIGKEIAILTQLVADMKKRDCLGRQRYGVPLQAHNGRDALTDAYQEALDLTVYLRQELIEREKPAARIAELEKRLHEAASARDQEAADCRRLRGEVLELRRRADGLQDSLDAVHKQQSDTVAELNRTRNQLAAAREAARKVFNQLNGATHG